MLLAGLTLAGQAQAAQPSYSGDLPPDAAAKELVRRISLNEAAASHHRPDYFFIQEERSDRTGQHLWVEAIAETPHGPLRRLLAEDGKPLDPGRQRQVDARVAMLAANPAALDDLNRSRIADQKQGEAMLAMSPEMFLYFDIGHHGDPKNGGTIEFAFKPNPAYVPTTYQERVIHAMTGTFVVDEATLRMVEIDGKLTDVVKFGYGLLGSVQSGNIHLVRKETSHGDYKPAVFDLSLNGHILLFHTLGKQQHLSRKDFVLMGEHATLAQAEKMVMAAKP